MDSSRRIDAARAFAGLASLNKDQMAQAHAKVRAMPLWKNLFGSFKAALAGVRTADYKPNGRRERERRMRQIEAGQLRRENGLETS